MTTVHGYARVSTDGQTLEAQQASLKAAGCEKVFSEKKAELEPIGRLYRPCSKPWVVWGDTLIVTRLDRLARSTTDLLNTLASIAEKGASFKSLSDGWADRFHVGLCARANRERSAVLCQCFANDLPNLSVVAYACHQGNSSLKNGGHVHTPSSPRRRGKPCDRIQLSDLGV